MLQNHSQCRNGRGCGQHPPEAYSPRGRRGSTPSEQESVNDSEEDRRFFADFEGQSVFDWEEISVLSMYQENYERPWRQRLVDSLGGEDVFSGRTEAWVASAAKRRQDPDEKKYRDEHHYRDHEEEERREEGLRMLLKEMRTRSSEEGWPLDKQMAALEPEDREDILQIMREELGWSKKKTTGKKSSMAATTSRNTTMTKMRKASSKQTPTTSKRRR